MPCTNCGASVDPGQMRCARCGSVVVQPQVVVMQETGQQAMKLCRRCSTMTPNSQIAVRTGRLGAGDWILGLLLCLFYVVPGIIYFIIKANQKCWYCPTCHKKNIYK